MLRNTWKKCLNIFTSSTFSLLSVHWRRWSWSMNWMNARPTSGWRSPCPGTLSTKTAPGYLSVRLWDNEACRLVLSSQNFTQFSFVNILTSCENIISITGDVSPQKFEKEKHFTRNIRWRHECQLDYNIFNYYYYYCWEERMAYRENELCCCSAWSLVLFPAGGFPFELTEGDIICVFSQYVSCSPTEIKSADTPLWCRCLSKNHHESSLSFSLQLLSGMERSSTSTWCETRRRGSPKASASSATRTRGAPSWLWTTSTASRWRTLHLV